MKRKIRTARAYAMALALATTISMSSCRSQDYSAEFALNNGQEYAQLDSKVMSTRSSSSTTTEVVFAKVRRIISEQMDVSENQVNLQSNLRIDLGMDSLDLVEIIMALEEEFRVEIPSDGLENLITVEDLVVYVIAQLDPQPTIDPIVFTKIQEIIELQLDISEVQVDLHSNLRTDLGMASLDFAEFIIAIENEFDLNIPDADFEGFITVENVAVYITTQLKSRPPVNPPVDPPVDPIEPPKPDKPDKPNPPTIDQDTVVNKIKEILSSKTGTPVFILTMETKFKEDLGMDEWAMIEFTMAIASEFNILIPDDSAQSMQTLGDCVRYVTNRL